MIDYKLREDMVLRTVDMAWIPKDERNADYKAFLEWIAAGNTPEPDNGEPT